MDNVQAVAFLNVTLYTEDPGPLRSFYHDLLGLPIDFEQEGHIAAMGPVCAHDTSEGPAGTVRLYFLADDPSSLAAEAADTGHAGTMRTDGYGQPTWETTDPFGNSVVILTRRPAT